MVPLQLLGATGPVGLVLALVGVLLVVALGSYLGVLLALQAFFQASSWEEAVGDGPD
jgi:hypothetical protein